MAKEGYWDDQFNQALPVFLANWFATTFIREIEQSCENEGVESLLKSTGGRYKTDLVGRWISVHTGAVSEVLSYLGGKDPIHRALKSRLTMMRIISGVSVKSINTTDEYPQQLADALDHALGKKIQETSWWRNNLPKIKRGSRSILAVKRVMEC